jgi:hypothetical protein
MDFVADALFDGRRLRALTVVDNYTRESLAIDVGQSLKACCMRLANQSSETSLLKRETNASRKRLSAFMISS